MKIPPKRRLGVHVSYRNQVASVKRGRFHLPSYSACDTQTLVALARGIKRRLHYTPRPTNAVPTSRTALQTTRSLRRRRCRTLRTHRAHPDLSLSLEPNFVPSRSLSLRSSRHGPPLHSSHSFRCAGLGAYLNPATVGVRILTGQSHVSGSLLMFSFVVLGDSARTSRARYVN